MNRFIGPVWVWIEAIGEWLSWHLIEKPMRAERMEFSCWQYIRFLLERIAIGYYGYARTLLLIFSPFIVITNLMDLVGRDHTHHNSPQALIRVIGEKAEAGDPYAMNKLAMWYWSGTEGLSENACYAIYWADKAARAGQAESQYIVASAFEDGHGVWKDEVLAYYWARTAQQNILDSKWQRRNSYLFEKLESERDINEISAFHSFKPEQQKPVWIYAGPWLAMVDDILTIGRIQSCR